MKKKVTVTGEVGKFFSEVSKEIGNQVFGRPKKKKKGGRPLIIHYH
ncbi:MAG: hypothetical protein GWN31_05895, partial [Candidatus Thorarchaeota archaeon]|nr:hypothetical protein [Candidatus Thorarchaeota archaeon]NIW13459.1 hypothetical protein [Candidatus Thorarchaeota archaeon]NIW51569.1 hypothetical protein [Candidatus Korarchaeota archaeon]